MREIKSFIVEIGLKPFVIARRKTLHETFAHNFTFGSESIKLGCHLYLSCDQGSIYFGRTETIAFSDAFAWAFPSCNASFGIIKYILYMSIITCNLIR